MMWVIAWGLRRAERKGIPHGPCHCLCHPSSTSIPFPALLMFLGTHGRIWGSPDSVFHANFPICCIHTLPDY
jgi:hypothetical protein